MLAAEGTYQSRPPFRPCVGRPHKQVVCALDMSAISTEAERGPKWPPCYRQSEPHKQVVCALDMSAISTEAERGPKWPHRVIGKVNHTTSGESPGKGVVGGQHAESLKLCNVAAQAAARRKQLITLPGMTLAAASGCSSLTISAAAVVLGLGSIGCCLARTQLIAQTGVALTRRSPPPAASARFTSWALLSLSEWAALRLPLGASS